MLLKTWYYLYAEVRVRFPTVAHIAVSHFPIGASGSARQVRRKAGPDGLSHRRPRRRPGQGTPSRSGTHWLCSPNLCAIGFLVALLGVECHISTLGSCSRYWWMWQREYPPFVVEKYLRQHKLRACAARRPWNAAGMGRLPVQGSI